MKTKEELTALKAEAETVTKNELSEEELEQVSGGVDISRVAEALKTIDTALQKVLNQETAIGATRNRLSYTSNNLSTSGENLQAAETTYRDADMAREMTAFTKENILKQTQQALLEQANQQSQSMLNLIQ